MSREAQTQKKQPSRKFTVADSSAEYDLSTSGLISSPRLPLQPLKTPNVGLSGRNNIFSSRTLSVPTSANRTPLPGLRAQISFKQSLTRDNSEDDPLQRMVNLKTQHTASQKSTRMRARHASAHIGSQLEQKLREDVDSALGFEQNSIIQSQRFKQEWQKKHSYVSARSAVPIGRKSYSKQRGDTVVSAISAYRSQMSGALPHIHGAASNSRGQTPFESAIKIAYDVEPSEFMSNVGLEVDNTSQYHMELMEEKREKIERILQKRQRKATLSQFGRQYDPTVSIKMQKQRLEAFELPDISPKTRRQIIQKVDTDNLNQHQLMKRKLSVSSGSSTELEGKKNSDGFGKEVSLVSESAAAGKLVQVKERIRLSVKPLGKKVNAQRYEKSFITQPDLETSKRVRNKSKVQKNSKEVNDAREPEEKMASPSLFDKHREAMAKVFDPAKVAQEMTMMTEVFIIKKGLGEPHNDVKSETKSNGNSPKAASDEKDQEPQAIAKVAPKQRVKKKVIVPENTQLAAAQTVLEQEKPSKVKKLRQRLSSKLSLVSHQAKQMNESERDVSTPDTDLSEQYQLVEGLVDKPTALRLQQSIRQKRKDEEGERPDFIKKALASASEGMKVDEGAGAEKADSDSSLGFQRQNLEEFNSELDIYSEIASVHSPSSPNRRHMLAKAHSLAMRAIPAEDSDEERGSDDDADVQSKTQSEGDEEGDHDSGQDDCEEDEANVHVMDVKEAYKKKLVDQAVAKREDEELCGRRLVKKIDDFALQVSVEAGILLPESSKVNNDATGDDLKQCKMLQTGNTSLFRLENSKNDDQGQYQKVMDKYFDEFRGQQAFFSLCKSAKESKWTDQNVSNPRMQYFAACEKNNSVAKPILSKIIDRALVLRDIKLNAGDAEGLRENFMMDPELINKLYLDQNGLDDTQLAIILDGFTYQSQLVNLTIQGNSVDEMTVERIGTMLKRKVPDNLQELHLIHMRASWHITEELLRQIRQRNYLRKLSLVEAGLNDFSMVHLCEVVRTQKTLQALDISWNQLRPAQMKPLLDILKKNRRLTSLNLAWNNIMEAKVEDQEGQYTRDIILMLGKIIKHSPTLQHMNLTGTGLNSQVIYEMGTILRRSRAIQSLHLSGNPGLNTENSEYLHSRIRCRANEDIERFTRIKATVKQVLVAAGASSNIISGIKMKVERATEFSQVHKNDPIEYSVNDQLVFQRMLGHKEDIPGSGQWYESSKNAVACKSHYKNECWICQGQIYCVIFWSKGMCYKMNPVLSADKTEVIRYEVDQDFGAQDEPDLMYTNTNMNYDEMEDQVPYLCGTFTGWRYRRMLSLADFNERFEPRNDAFEVACSRGQIRKKVVKRSQCNEYEERYVEIAKQDEHLRMMYAWRAYFAKNLRYKRSFFLNAHYFYEMPSRDGTIPEEDDHPMAVGEVFQDTSSEESTEEEKEEEVVEEIDDLLLTREQKEEMKMEQERRLRNPLPRLADATKFDKVFILPIFIRPGQHHYMIKYKDTTEQKQANLLKKISNEEKRKERTAIGKHVSKPFNEQEQQEAKDLLAPQCFFYNCDMPKRKEEIPVFAKPMQSKVVTRLFGKDQSVFKPWRLDTAGTTGQAFNEDIKMWKGYRFIKSEEDRANTEAVLKKHFMKLKDVFLFLAANSVWPNIGTLDFCEFASKSKIIDNAIVNISTVDRAFIGATLKVAESTAPQNGLRRFEFLEILVRLANIKYVETKVLDTFAEATDKLINDTILAHFTPEPWQEFRDSQLWTMDVNDTFQANLGNMKIIYDRYKQPSKPNMDLNDCLTMCTQNTSIGLSEKDIAFCYNYSHQTVVSEDRQWKKYMSLEFVEFLEFIGRVAHARFKNSSPEMASQPLAQKIDFILDELMQGHGLIRQEVNIEVFEFSESDDDY